MIQKIPRLNHKLASVLQHIIDNKYYNPQQHENWQDLKSMIIERLESLQTAIPEENGHLEELSSQNTLGSHINLIKSQLQLYFEDEPPFTILRISEVILRGQQEGYKLENSTDLLKYFNAVSKLFNVSLPISKFPVPEMLEAPQTKSIDDDIKMIQIPWLDDVDPADIEKVENEKRHVEEDEDDISDAKRLKTTIDADVMETSSPIENSENSDNEESNETNESTDKQETELD